MISNYFKVIVRLLARQKMFAFINVFGLTVGLAGFILIYLYVTYEINYDKHNEKLDRLYMIVRDVHMDNSVYNFTPVPIPFKDEIVGMFPEIEKATRYDGWGRFLFNHGNETFDEPVLMADPEYFEMFTFRFLEGDASKPLPDDNSVAISKAIANKYFGGEAALGKVFHVNGNYDFTVSAVFDNPPPNSSLKHDIVLPYMFYRKLGQDFSNWNSNEVNVFLLLHPATDVAAFEKKLEPQLAVHQPGEQPDKLFLHPMKDYHLHNFRYKGGAIQFVYLFSAIGLVILVLAGINYVNLVTARSVRRAKEIGVRKTVGANKTQVVSQFLGESVLLSLIALNFGVLVVELLLPMINPIIGKALALDYSNPRLIIALLSIGLVTGIVAGAYPAFYLSRFNPSGALKDSKTSGKGTFKSALVIVQFSVSIALIITSMVLYKQLVFLKNLPTGITRDNIFYFKLEEEAKQNRNALRQALSSTPGVSSVSFGGHLPTEIFSNGGGYQWEGKDPDQDVLISHTRVDDEYLETFDIRVTKGRFYEKGEVVVDTINQTVKVVINERFAGILAFDDPLGKAIQVGRGWRFEIIGVISDFNFQRMRAQVGPLMMFYSPSDTQFGFVRGAGDVNEVKSRVEAEYLKLFPKLPPDFRLFEDRYQTYFGTESQSATFFGYFTVLAILISCLGLYGLASYIAEQRRKEMGIRKALGANTAGLSMLMMKDFAIWIAISNVVAIPLAWYYSNELLAKYAFRTDISLWIFVLAGLSSVVIAGATVLLQILKTAGQNPAMVLKYE